MIVKIIKVYKYCFSLWRRLKAVDSDRKIKEIGLRFLFYFWAIVYDKKHYQCYLSHSARWSTWINLKIQRLLKNKFDKVYKLYLGNGPSGICLSYMLSGNWPYYTWNSDEEMLHARLMEEPEASLVQQDLEFLSDVSFIFSNWANLILVATWTICFKS